jgi:GntR family transcriptional regulator/MocR family aminotransferase
VPALASLWIAIDRRAAVSLQDQVADGIRAAIAGGTIATGTRLPGSRVLASELAVSRTTVVAALLQLAAEGVLVARERSGFFAGAPPRAAIRAPTVAGDASLAPSRRGAAMAVGAPATTGPRPLAFRLARSALDAFPVRLWSRILSRRAGRVSIGQLDYGPEWPPLQAAVAGLLGSARGLAVAPEQVLLFAGSQRALDFVAATMLDPGDVVAVEDPGYPGARQALRGAGAVIVDVAVDGEGLDVAAAARLVPAPRLVYTTPACQYPTGVALSAPRRAALVAWASGAGACIVEDDYDAEARLGGPPPPPLGALAPGRVLHVGSFSRTMFPSLRIGYLVVPDHLVDRLRAARAALEEPLPSLFQIALADFIEDGHYARHLRRLAGHHRARRDALLAATTAAGIAIRPGSTGLHLVADLGRLDATAVSVAAAGRGVEAVPLARFATSAPAPSALVLGFGAVPPERMKAPVAELARALDDARAAAGRRRPRGGDRAQ